MRLSIPRLNLRQNWPLIVAAAAFIIGMAAFFALPNEINVYSLDSQQVVDYWAMIRQFSLFIYMVGVCLGFWLLFAVLVILMILRPRRRRTAVLTIVLMLMACFVMSWAAVPALLSDYYVEDWGMVSFNQHVYHLALYTEGGDDPVTKLILFECDPGDTQCTGRSIPSDLPVQLGQASSVSLMVDPAANQLQVKTNDQIIFQMDASAARS